MFGIEIFGGPYPQKKQVKEGPETAALSKCVRLQTECDLLRLKSSFEIVIHQGGAPRRQNVEKKGKENELQMVHRSTFEILMRTRLAGVMNSWNTNCPYRTARRGAGTSRKGRRK